MRDAAALRRAILPFRRGSILISWMYVGFLVVLPLLALARYAVQTPWEAFVASLTEPRTLAALGLSFGAALVAALLCVPVGLAAAWVLSRYAFPAPLLRVVDALIDVPFAMPTAAAGIALATVWGPEGIAGRWLASVGVQVAYARPGIVLAMIFLGVPFVVRAVQPVLEAFPFDREEAAWSLGATPWQTAWRVVLPALRPALLTGFTLAFARALGEYGAVIYIAGNVPLQTEIAPLLIVSRLEQFDYTGAAALALVLMLVAFGALAILQRLEGTGHDPGVHP